MADSQQPDTSQYDGMDFETVLEHLHAAKRTLDDLKAQQKVAQQLWDFLSLTIAPDRFEKQNVTNITIDGFRYGLRSDLQTSVLKDNRGALYDWLREHDMEDLITETVHAMTLKAWVKEQMMAGNELPDDLLSIHAFTRATITRA